MRKLWITGCIVMICMGMLTACGGNKTEVVPIGDTEEADREVPYAMYINRVEERVFAPGDFMLMAGHSAKDEDLLKETVWVG